MTVTAVTKDIDNLTLTLTAEFRATPERVWQLWADPRQLERWWGPPSYPATFTSHDLREGAHIQYHMTGPEGETPRSFWDILAVDPPRHLTFRDGFANDDGTPNTNMPVITADVSIDPIDGESTRMLIQSRFPSLEALEQLSAMGMEDGLRQAVGQIDDILAEAPATA